MRSLFFKISLLVLLILFFSCDRQDYFVAPLPTVKAPQSVKAFSSRYGITVRWSRVHWSSEYVVFYDTIPEVSLQSVSSPQMKDTLFYLYDKSGQRYYFRVITVDSLGHVSKLSKEVSARYKD